VTGREPGADHPDGDPWEPDDLDAFVIPDDLSGLVELDRSDTSEPDANEPSAAEPDTDEPDLSVPDSPASLEEPVTIAVLLTQVVAAEPLAAVCSLAGVQAEAIGSTAGSVAVLTDPTSGAGAAADVSRLLPGTEVVLLERRDGSIVAAVWSRGTREEEVAPGLVLAEGPAVLEDLLLGDTTAADLEGTVSSAGMSRFKAMRLLAKAARRTRER
jgi:hypothetical protein